MCVVCSKQSINVLESTVFFIVEMGLDMALQQSSVSVKQIA